MGTFISFARSKLLTSFAKNEIEVETNKKLNEVTADFFIKIGFFTRVAVFLIEEKDNNILPFVEKIMKNFKYPFVKKTVIFTESTNTFWLDVLALYSVRNPNISFFVSEKDTLIGEFPQKILKVFDTFYNSSVKINRHLPKIISAYTENNAKEISAIGWLKLVEDIYKKYLVSVAFTYPKCRIYGNLKLIIIGTVGHVFLPEITEEVLKKSRSVLTSYSHIIQKVVLVGIFAHKRALENAGNGISIYALHLNYQWLSGKIKDRDKALENFFKIHSGIKLVKYNIPSPIEPVIVPATTVLLVSFVAGLIVQALLKRANIFTCGITCAVAITFGWLSCKYKKIGYKEYAPAAIYSGLSGVITVALFWLISNNAFIDTASTGNIKDGNLYLIFQSALFFDLSIMTGIIYSVFTKLPSTYICPLPKMYGGIEAGKNIEIIKATINSWDRGWALTIPNLASSIAIDKVNALIGYAVILDTLFEKRWVSIGERPCAFGKSRSYKAAMSALNAKITMARVFFLSFPFPHSPRFDKYRDSVSFTGMAESCTCPRCGGSGTVTCSTCMGSGWVNVSQTEYHTESYTDFDGQRKTRTVSKTVYKRERCSICGGSGRVQCPRCSGSGAIEIYPVLNCLRHHKQHRDCIDPTIGRGLEKVIYKADSKVLIETPIKDGLIKTNEILGREIPQEAAQLVQRLTTTVEHIQTPQITIIRQRLILHEVPISEIDYGYKKKAYQLWVYGYDKRVHALKSPINLFRLLVTIFIALITLGVNIIALWPLIDKL